MLLQQNTIKENNCLRQSWKISASEFSKRTRNSIREIVENLQIEPNPDKSFIPLSIGDPTVFGNLLPASESLEAIEKSLKSLKCNGYAPSCGYLEAREAVANYTNQLNGVNINPNDVVLASGCSGALELCIYVLGERGKNILVPRPGFCIYATLAEGLGVEIRYYDLIPDKNWEINLTDLESKIDTNTVAIVVINPSNPCGSVYSEEHLRSILKIAEDNYVPIIADEIYEHIVFPNNQFISLGKLSENVPILSCSGLAKRFLVPGWRLGWIIIHDRNDVFKEEVRKYLQSVSQRINGPNSLIQGGLKDILTRTPSNFYEKLVTTLYDNAKIAFTLLCEAPGLKPIMPQGAMYMMVGVKMKYFPNFQYDSLIFVQKLIEEQSVFLLPGQCFNYPGYMRLVLTVPQNLLTEACNRIIEFCVKYYKRKDNSEKQINEI